MKRLRSSFEIILIWIANLFVDILGPNIDLILQRLLLVLTIFYTICRIIAVIRDLKSKKLTKIKELL